MVSSSHALQHLLHQQSKQRVPYQLGITSILRTSPIRLVILLQAQFLQVNFSKFLLKLVDRLLLYPQHLKPSQSSHVSLQNSHHNINKFLQKLFLNQSLLVHLKHPTKPAAMGNINSQQKTHFSNNNCLEHIMPNEKAELTLSKYLNCHDFVVVIPAVYLIRMILK